MRPALESEVNNSNRAALYRGGSPIYYIMTGYVFRRLIRSVFTILAVVTIIFFLLNLLPGDAALLGGDLRRSQDEDVLNTIRQKWGLDKPLPQRYFLYIINLLKGDLGTSYRASLPVVSLIGQSIVPTLKLSIFAFIISVIFGLSIGSIAAVNRGSFLDFFSMFFSIFGISAPRFWIGLIFMYLFATTFKILPATGYGNGQFSYLILPAFTLSLPLIAFLARTTRATILDVIEEDYVRTARAKGLSNTIIYIKHVFRNSLISIITIGGLQLGTMLANTVIVEKVFSYPGLGNLIVDSIHRRDIPAVQGCVLFFSLSFILINLTIDCLYGYIDPRISYN